MKTTISANPLSIIFTISFNIFTLKKYHYLKKKDIHFLLYSFNNFFQFHHLYYFVIIFNSIIISEYLFKIHKELSEPLSTQIISISLRFLFNMLPKQSFR